jgi:1-deoxy-D-xylulose-5-phosphate synthase
VSLLHRIADPRDLRRLAAGQLPELAREIREFLVTAVAPSGGHLGPNLGAVELTIALHRVFDSPNDRILFDTGHQAYVHKLLTGRHGGFGSLRRQGGLSGYPSRSESAHDLIENSHASTALSYADGFAKANALVGAADRHVVAVVGDGALTGGMAWEALNNIGAAPQRPVIVVLNDNGRSYCPTVGALARHLGRLRAGGTASAQSVFEHLGLHYLGPVDGHDEPAVERALRQARALRVPVLVHCVTAKGRGYPPAERDETDRLHSPAPFEVATGQPRSRSGASWTSLFGAEMVALGDERPDVVAVTAAMLHPTGLAAFAQRHPDRSYDVGIAEQHAVTSAAGMASAGLHPVVAVYSTFLNRAFDQVLMDVALHRLPVTFVLDRAGVTGDDGASHNGMWDMSILQVVPGLRIAAPRDGSRLRELLREAVGYRHGPTVVRFPKGELGADLPAVDRIGGVDVLARHGDPDVLLIGFGPVAASCVAAAAQLRAVGIGTTVIDPRWAKPVDRAVVNLARGHRLVVVAEDNGRAGGAGDAVARLLRDREVDVPVRTIGVPQRFLDHARRTEVLHEIGLTPDGIARCIAGWLPAVDRQPLVTAAPALT